MFLATAMFFVEVTRFSGGFVSVLSQPTNCLKKGAVTEKTTTRHRGCSSGGIVRMQLYKPLVDLESYNTLQGAQKTELSDDWGGAPRNLLSRHSTMCEGTLLSTVKENLTAVNNG